MVIFGVSSVVLIASSAAPDLTNVMTATTSLLTILFWHELRQERKQERKEEK